MNRHTLAARDVTLAYEKRTVVHGLDLDVPQGMITSIIGANGCGKSTFLRALARMLTPRSGSVLLDGKAIGTMPTRQVATMIGLMPQSPTAPEGLNIVDLVSRGRFPYHGLTGSWTERDERAVAHALTLTGLQDLADRPVDEVSGGQRQRAWIALALAQQTDILLLDEPTTYLDIAYQFEVLDLLAELNRNEGTTIVMVLHDLNLAARYSDRILAMNNGRVATFGTPREVMTESLVWDVFGVDANIIPDPMTGLPTMLPTPGHSLQAMRAGRDGSNDESETFSSDSVASN